MDAVKCIKAKEGDLPVLFIGESSKAGIQISEQSTRNGKMIKIGRFTVVLYDRAKDVEYCLKKMGKDYITYHKDKYDCIDAVAYNADATYLSELPIGAQIVGCGALRSYTDQEGNEKIRLIVSGVFHYVSQPEKKENGHYERISYDSLQPIVCKNGEIPVAFAGTRGNFDPKVNNVEINGKQRNVANYQIDFFKQNQNLKYLEDVLKCDRIAYQSDFTSSVRVSSWGKDVDRIMSTPARNQVIGCGSAKVHVARNEMYKDSIEFTTNCLVYLFKKDSIVTEHNEPFATESSGSVSDSAAQTDSSSDGEVLSIDSLFNFMY